MTLASFKRNLKVSFIILNLVLYGGISFWLGKNLSLKNPLKNQEQVQKKGPKIEQPQPYSDTQSSQVIASLVKLCSNTFYGFEIAYPQDWFTTYNTDEQKCTFFAPYAFVVPSNPGIDFVPVKIEVVNTDDWLNTVKFFENPNDFQNVLSSQNIEVSGRSVKKITATATEKNQLQKGFFKISYLVFDPKTPIIVTYQQQENDENIQSYQKILEEMVSTLKYF